MNSTNRRISSDSGVVHSGVATNNPELVYLVGLIRCGIGRRWQQKAIDSWGSLEAWWRVSVLDMINLGIKQEKAQQLQAELSRFNPVKYFQSLVDNNIDILFETNPLYPTLLNATPSPPQVLFTKGNVSSLNSPAIAVVGTRKPTQYGKEITKSLVSRWTDGGYMIVSGLAYGIDAIAHRACLDAGGISVAVLGSPINQVTPVAHTNLASDIVASNGCVISEYPPGVKVFKQNFPARNRIIAGLAKATIVTEGAIDSGSLITADFAVKFGRFVGAVPGPVSNSMSRGPHQLLAHGKATLVTSADEVLSHFEKEENTNLTSLNTPNFSTDIEHKIYSIVKAESLSIDELNQQVGIRLPQLQAILTRMELAGYLCVQRGFILVRG